MRAWWFLPAVFACTTGGAGDAPDTDTDTDVAIEVPDDLTYHRDVRPIFAAHCEGCHSDGGIAPFDIRYDEATWASGAPAWSAAAVGAVAARTMPPWHAATDCHPIEGSKALPAKERAFVEAWAEKGFPVGDPADYVAPELPAPVDLGAPDLELHPSAAYTPDVRLPDDYHCVALGPALAEDLDVRALEIVPGDARIVHHAILYVVGPEDAADVDVADADFPGVGYPCFGGPIPGGGGLESTDFTNAGTYVPGYEAEVLPQGDARRWIKGSRLVLQLHYNLLAVPDGEPTPSDASFLKLWRFEGTPTGIITTVALPNYEFLVPAGAPESVHTKTFSFGADAEVVGAMAHMHTLGASLTLEVERDGQELCVLDVPRWDFDWQRAYRFPTDDPFWLQKGDVVKMTCVYDNSAGNQPTVNGVKQEPKDVRWGEGTLDEMCLAYAFVRIPSALVGASDCANFETCFLTCPEGDGPCIGRCLLRATDACSACGVLALGGCAGASGCAGAFVPLAACLDTCDDGTVPCLRSTCRAEAEDYLSCLDDDVRAGTCDPWLGECGISFAD